MKLLSDTEQASAPKMGGLLPLVIVGAGGVGAYFLYKYFSEQQTRESIDKSNKNILASTMSIAATKQRIASIEDKATIRGLDGYNKTVTVNFITQAKDIINEVFIIIEDKDQKKYYLKSVKNWNEPKIRRLFFSTPLKALGGLSKVYSIYTGKNINEIISKLSQNTQAEIKTLYNVAYKKYGIK